HTLGDVTTSQRYLDLVRPVHPTLAHHAMLGPRLGLTIAILTQPRASADAPRSFGGQLSRPGRAGGQDAGSWRGEGRGGLVVGAGLEGEQFGVEPAGGHEL